jgi:hypothetical protein
MSDRDVPFEEFEVCDSCGHIGAFDFMGDYYCAECLATIFSPIDDELIRYTGEEEK